MPIKRTVRGIRDSLPPGYIIGRAGSTDGPAQLISLKELTLAQQTVMPGGQLSKPGGTSADFGFFFQGKPGFSNMIIATMVLTRSVTLPIHLTGSQFVADSPPLADYTVTILQNGTPVGDITFAATTGDPTATFTTAVIYATGDILTLQGPSVADAGVQDISFNFAATFL